jgi:hypothetical protein
MLGSRAENGPGQTPRYTRPKVLDEALALRESGAQIVAGGTDFYPARVGKPLSTGRFRRRSDGSARRAASARR